MKQIGIIHKLRGIAAIMVFFFHLIYLSEDFFNFFNARHLFFLGKYGIHVFFVISGFVIIHSLILANYHWGKWGTFMLKRFIRIEPAYIVVLLLTFGYFTARGLIVGPNHDTPTIKQLLLHIGYLIPFSGEKWLSIVFWSLAVEFQFYFLVSIVYTLLIKSVIYRWIIYLIFWALQFIFPSVEFFCWSLVFVLGMQLAFFKHRIITKFEFTITFYLLPVLIFFNFDLNVTLFSFFTFFLIFLGKDFKSQVFDFLGNISYSLYLMHMLVYFSLYNIALKHFRHDTYRPFVLGIIVLVVLISSYLLYRFVEKPSKRVAGMIKYEDKLVFSEVPWR